MLQFGKKCDLLILTVKSLLGLTFLRGFLSDLRSGFRLGRANVAQDIRRVLPQFINAQQWRKAVTAPLLLEPVAVP